MVAIGPWIPLWLLEVDKAHTIHKWTGAEMYGSQPMIRILQIERSLRSTGTPGVDVSNCWQKAPRDAAPNNDTAVAVWFKHGGDVTVYAATHNAHNP